MEPWPPELGDGTMAIPAQIRLGQGVGFRVWDLGADMARFLG